MMLMLLSLEKDERESSNRVATGSSLSYVKDGLRNLKMESLSNVLWPLSCRYGSRS